MVDDVAGSDIFRKRPTLEPTVEVGSRAVHSYPLLSVGGGILGVLSFHYPYRFPASNMAALVAAGTVSALMQVGATP